MFAMSLPIASATTASAVWLDRRIRIVEWMPEFAVCLGTIPTIRSTSTRSRLLLLARYSTACSAKASAGFRDARVLWRVFVAVIAVCASSKICCGVGAAEDVLFWRHWLKVRRANTEGIATKMVESEAVREKTVFTLPHPNPCANRFAVSAETAIEPTVAGLNTPSPNPTPTRLRHVFGGRAVFTDLLKNLLVGQCWSCHAQTLTYKVD